MVKNAMGDALGSCAHCTRIGADSYERPIVAYTSARKPKVLKMGPVKSPVQTFHSQIGGPISGPWRVPCGQDVRRDRIPVWTGPESAQKGTAVYQVLKVEISNSRALWSCRQEA